MKYFSAETVREIMNFTNEEIEKELKEGNWNISDEWEKYTPDKKREAECFGVPDLLPKAIVFAQKKYPGKTREIGIFATHIEGFATGMWGGFGQDQDPLYEKAQDVVLALAGGIPASINDPEEKIFGWAADKTLLNQEEFTKAGIQLLENICFRSKETALEQALECLSGSIALQEKSRQAFKSPKIEESKALVERAKGILERILK